MFAPIKSASVLTVSLPNESNGQTEAMEKLYISDDDIQDD
jgi:hypothetical protein